VEITTTVGSVCDNGKRVVTFKFNNKCGVTLSGQINFGDGSAPNINLVPGQTTTATHLYSPGNYTAFLIISGCPEKPIAVTVEPCPACCDVDLSAQISDKCDNGKRSVKLDINNKCGTGINGQIDFGNSPPTSIPLVPGLNSVPHTYAPGTYTVVLKLPNCPEKKITFTVPPCCCPKTNTTVKVGECTVGGKTQVCLVTTVDVPAGCETVLKWNFGDGQSSGNHTFGPGSNTFTECHDYAPGSYSAQLTIVSPHDCQTPAPVTVNVPDCDCCPSISVTPCIEDCDKGERTVKFTVTVNAKPSPCPDVEVQLDFGDGSTGGTHSYPPSGSGSYVETHTYSGSSALQDNTVTLSVLQPKGCPGWSMIIPKCCNKKLTNWCTIFFNAMTGLLALALALFFLKFLCSAPVPTSVIYGLLGLFAVALLIYLILQCWKCRCGWLYLLIWRVLFGVGLLLSIFAGCPTCSIWTFWIGLALMFLAFFFLLLWKKACCVKLCVFLKEIVLWMGATILPLVGVILSYIGAGCLFILFSIAWPITFTFTFYLLVLILWGFLLNYYVSNCSK
jgi:hypothetical protein